MIAFSMIIVIWGILLTAVFQYSLRAMLVHLNLDNNIIREVIAHVTLVNTSFTIAGAILVLLVVFVISKVITAPLAKLTEAFQAMASGNLNVRVDIPNEDEIGQLAEAFNKMAADLQKVSVSRSELIQEARARQKTEAFLKDILESVEPLVIIGRDYKIISANSAYCRHVNLEFDDILGRHCYEVSHQKDSPCTGTDEVCALKDTFETAKSASATHTHRDNFGNATLVEIKTFPMKDSRGNVTAVIEAISDISYRKQMASEFEKKMGELEKFYNFAVDRELKMVELKKKVREMEEKLNKERGS